ncbi:MAG: thymidine phosphorylase [Eubacteriaceae bacterium]|nr:thymidine phosphorylase [Eubacteriaceae bacterium]
MNMYDIIDKKKNKKALSETEIRYFVEKVTSGEIPDYQTSALLMAICLNGMNDEETAILTDAMMRSGDVLDLSEIPGIKADKHSTGGVGDKTSLVLEPILAACGLVIAKMSGRGLGHTGGTIDKLESIPGFKTEYSMEEFIEIAKKTGIIIAAQSGDIAPADKKLYALRDVTATVDNISLIASSIMSKKLACGADCIVLDVKTGSGAFMEDLEQAVALAEKMVAIGKAAGKSICAVISDMNQPLGYAVGNALEVKEAIDTLNGGGPADLLELCLCLGENELIHSGICKNAAEARQMMINAIKSGRAKEKFKDMVRGEGGNEDVADNTDLLPKAPFSLSVKADKDGYVSALDCKSVGGASMLTGAGRRTKEDIIDFSAGILLKKKVTDRVEKGEELAVIYSSDRDNLKAAEQRLKAAYEISDTPPAPGKLIYAVIN